MYKFFKMTALCAALAAAGAAGAGTITFDGTSLSIEAAWKLAAGAAAVALAPAAVKLLEGIHKLVMASAAKGQAVYGLTVGVGLYKDQKLFTADGKLSSEVLEASRAFNYTALRSHSAGVGEMMPVDLARLSMVVRLNTLLAGKSGAQVRVAELYRDMLNKTVTPLLPSAGSVGVWIGATVMLIAAMAAIAILFTAVSLSWPIAVSALICFAAPSFPFTGFSYPLESMTPGAAFFGQLLPLTHYLAVQGECWILNSPLDHVFTRLAPLALLIVVPMAAGLPILGVRLRAWSSKDPEKDRIRTLLVKESLITDETQGGAR